MKYQFQDGGEKLLFYFGEEVVDLPAGRMREDTTVVVLNFGEAQSISLDDVEYDLPAKSVFSFLPRGCTRFSRSAQLIVWEFSRGLYEEGGMVSPDFLFYAGRCPFFICLSSTELERLLLLGRQWAENISVRDALQAGMVRALVAQLIILIARISDAGASRLEAPKAGILRKFNLLVEANFRREHMVRFYARAMGRTPKALCNLFSTYGLPAPSRLIRMRIIKEAKRYACFTDMSAKEIGGELGFASAAHFSRFFKVNTGISYSRFKGAEIPASVDAPAGDGLESESRYVEMGIGGKSKESVVVGYAKRLLQLPQI